MNDPMIGTLRTAFDRAKQPIRAVLPERVRQSPYGPRLLVDAADYVERTAGDGSFERETVEYFRDLVRTEGHSRFTDVGANVGFYSLLFDDVAPAPDWVDVVEPLPSNLARLSRNLGLNDVRSQFRIFPCGLSDDAGNRSLSVAEDNLAEASLADVLSTDSPDGTRTVQMRTLDDIYVGSGTAPDLVKLDIEGAEFNAILGGRETLAAHRPDLLLEMHFQTRDEFDDVFRRGLSALADAGYTTVHHVETGRDRPLDGFGVDDLDHGGLLHVT